MKQRFEIPVEFDGLISKTANLSFLKGGDTLFSLTKPQKSKICYHFTLERKPYSLICSAVPGKAGKNKLHAQLNTLFYFLIAEHSREELKTQILENKRHLLFAQTLGSISTSFIGNIDITKHLKSILGQIASFINASAGVITFKLNGLLTIESFGFDANNFNQKTFIRPLLGDELRNIYPLIKTHLISNITVGSRIIGQFIFINKETRNGIEEFNLLDSLLIETIANQLIISLKKTAYYVKQKEHFALMRTVIDSISGGIVATDRNNTIIIANKNAGELFNQTGSLKERFLEDIFPKVSPLKNYLLSRIAGEERSQAETLLYSVTDPKLIRVNAAPLQSAKYSGYVFAFEDVTEINKIKENFSKYVSHELMEQFAKKNFRTRLGGETITASVFFSDIRGFTSLSELNSAEEIVDTLNQYYNLMISIIYENGGYVDKLVGDEIMAVFKIKEGLDSPAVRSVRAALQMRSKLEYFNEVRGEQNLFTLSFGVGINYGEVIIGNIGSFNRMDYTVIGDNVNLASRLCSKAEPNQILISESTQSQLPRDFAISFLEDFYAKGKQQPVKVYEVK